MLVGELEVPGVVQEVPGVVPVVGLVVQEIHGLHIVAASGSHHAFAT